MPRELPDGQAGALQQGPRLAGEDVHAPACVQLERDGQRRALTAGGQRAGVAVREQPPRAVQQVGAGRGDGRAGRVLLGVDGLRLRADRCGERRRARRETGRADALDGPREVRRCGAGVAQLVGSALEGTQSWLASDLHGKAVGRGDADERRAPDREAPDGGGGAGRARGREPHLLARQPRLVQEAQAPAVPAQSAQAPRRDGHGAMLSRDRIASVARAPVRRDDRRPLAHAGRLGCRCR